MAAASTRLRRHSAPPQPFAPAKVDSLKKPQRRSSTFVLPKLSIASDTPQKEATRRASLILLDGTFGLTEDYTCETRSSLDSGASTEGPASDDGSGLSDTDEDDDDDEHEVDKKDANIIKAHNKSVQDAQPCESESSNSVMLMLLLVVCGCACQAPMEVMTARDKGCAHLISLVEYMFGIIASMAALRAQRRLPWGLHLGLAGANISYSMLLNVALGSALPTVALVTMKNGNLVANMLLGVLVLRRTYTLRQYLAVLGITLGLVAASWRGGGRRGEGYDHLNALFGVSCLTGALLSRAAGGVVQELYCRGHGAPVSELLFFRSLPGLPLILTQWRSISDHAMRWSTEHQISGLPWPTFWVLLAANVLFDYLCKVCMTRLIGQTSALVGTLVLTCQKFLSFVISAFALSMEAPGWNLWVGATAVLVGTVVYSFAPKAPQQLSDNKVKAA